MLREGFTNVYILDQNKFVSSKECVDESSRVIKDIYFTLSTVKKIADTIFCNLKGKKK